MKKKYIVKENKDFEEIIKDGICLKNRSFIVHIKPNNLQYDRFGISVSKKLGNAVFRNKYKRKIRAIIDNYKKNYIKNKDYIIILRRSGAEKNFHELEKDLVYLLKNE